MRYFLIILLLFVGCADKKQNKKVYIEDVIPQVNTTKPKVSKIKAIKIIHIKDLSFTEQNNSFKYLFDKNKILLFVNDNKFSKLQIKELKKFNHKFYIINNKKLIQFFKIKKYPTILITKETNKTKRYEGFIPNEILKYEIKD